MKDLRQRAENFAKLQVLEFTTERPNNGFGGYENGLTTVWLHDNEVRLIVTCANFGDGTRIDITNLINN